MTESDLAQNIISWLQDHNWEVYQEVSLHPAGGIRADIVAKMGSIVWVIETKTTFGLQVLAQAWEWTRHAHYVSIATPYRKHNSTYAFERDLLTKNGIGLIYAQIYGHGEDAEICIKEEFKPVLHRHVSLPHLHEKHKTYAKAGNNRCEYYSSFKQTKENLIKMVQKHNPIPYTDLIKKIDYHYKSLSTAKSCIRQYIDKRIIPELTIYSENNKLMVKLTPTDTIMDHPKALQPELPPIINTDFNDLIHSIEQFKLEANI